MLSAVVDVLACPVCGGRLRFAYRSTTQIYCPEGHTFDIARQGHVSLLGGAGKRFDGDGVEMVDARERFLGAGHYRPFMEALADGVSDVLVDLGMPRTEDLDAGHLLGEAREPVVCEIGAGTGHYLSHVLEHLDQTHGVNGRGVGIDASVPAARRLARRHDRIGAVVADAWSEWPVRSGSVDVVTAAFAPRNIAEFARVLRPGGGVVMLTPGSGHLAELVEELGLVRVDERKRERLEEQLDGVFRPVGEERSVSTTLELTRADVLELVGMGPSARHIDEDELGRRVAALPEAVEVTAEAIVGRYAQG